MERAGIVFNRSNMCRCPFHQDKTASMKVKPVRREKSPMQILEEAKTKTYRVLSDYFHLLKEWERNFKPKSMDEIDAMEVREDDEKFKNPVDMMFDELAEQNPDHFVSSSTVRDGD